MSEPAAPPEASALGRLPAAVAGRLLRHALADRRPRPERQVFVNRALRLEKIRYVGFDLDWTLANYDLDALSHLAFRLTLERLVTAFDYPRSILTAEYRPRFARRGLMIDIEAGTVLKMSRHRYVGRAYHGRQFLDTAERARLYRTEPLRTTGDRFYFADTFFELPEINLLSELVEMTRRKGAAAGLPAARRIFADVRAAMDSIHADGTLKNRIVADLPRYLPRDEELVLAIQRLALGGRRLLLITNSEWSYTDAVLRYLLADVLPGLGSWRELFDLAVVGAGKPGFFRKARRFVALGDGGQAAGEVEVPVWGGLYAGGSLEGLMKLVAGLGEEMLYVGDHIYGDILSSKLASTWRTALIVRELEEELVTLREFGSQLRALEVLRAELADVGQRMDDLRDVLTLSRALSPEASGAAGAPPEASDGEARLGDIEAEHRVLRHHAKRIQERISRALNPYWGSVFKQGGNKSLFGSQVDDFACLYTSRVSNFAYYGSDHYYRVRRDLMMHEQGF
jgi:HAD superfamily 5'-nucleotidase-like hydrolase